MNVASLGALAIASTLGACAPEPATLAFPTGFQWGVATAAHETEGQNDHSDWAAFEELGAVPPAGWAQNGLTLYDTDAANAAALGLNTFQLGIEWARVVPRRPADPTTLSAADLDPAAVAHYHDVLASLRDRGLAPVVAVTHFSLPRWLHDPAAYDVEAGTFASAQGWLGDEVPTALAAWAGFLAEEYGDEVGWWITVDEPMVVLLAGYVSGDFPPGMSRLDLGAPLLPDAPAGSAVHGKRLADVMANMIDAHARAYHAIKARRPNAVVTLAQNVVDWQPAVPGVDDDAATRVDALYNLAFLDAVTSGSFDRSLGLGTELEQHPEWAGTVDVLGVNSYDSAFVVDVPGLLPPLEAFPCSPALRGAMPALYAVSGCPELALDEARGTHDVLVRLAGRYGLPLLVTENGFIDTAEGKARKLVATLAQIHAAIDDGTDVVGYHYWTLNHDYEWNSGWSEHMGLFSIAGISTEMPGAPGPDTDFTRVAVEPFASTYAAVARAGGVPTSLLQASE